ncbi:MAG: choice-of-anchor J domain-containing protein [Flavisolibacter sp.]
MIHKNHILTFALLAFTLFTIVNGCEKDYEPLTQPVSKSFTEEFDTVINLYSKGWAFINNSRPLGAATWQQGVYENGKMGPDGFPAHSYTSSGDEYIFAGYASGSGLATLSSWMMTPEIEMKNGDVFSFYTRTYTGSTFPDRLQIRFNPVDGSTDVGHDATSVGKFTTLLGDINPSLATGTNGYPQKWTKYQFTLSGLNGIVKRRIAFRYYVTNGGPNGGNSNAIGIDQFHFESL